MNYPTVFDLLDNAVQELGVRLILIGGFAVNAFGVGRNTQDVDFLILETDYLKLKDFLLAQGYEEVVRTDVFAKQTAKDRYAMPVDFLFTDPHTFEMIFRDSVGTTISGHAFKTPSLLHLVALKLHAIKKGSKDRVWKDLPDIINMVIANRIDTDSSDFMEICRKFGPEGIHQRIQEASRRGPDGRS
ncbi:MAG: nucleotidyltransferase [Candidatus Omnitrophota bacterium]